MKKANARNVSGSVSAKNGCVAVAWSVNAMDGTTYANCTASNNSPKPRLMSRNGGVEFMRMITREKMRKKKEERGR